MHNNIRAERDYTVYKKSNIPENDDHLHEFHSHHQKRIPLLAQALPDHEGPEKIYICNGKMYIGVLKLYLLKKYISKVNLIL